MQLFNLLDSNKMGMNPLRTELTPDRLRESAMEQQNKWPYWQWQRWAAAIALLAGGLALVGPRWIEAKAESLVLAESSPALASPALRVETLALEPVSTYQVQRSYTGEVKAARASELGFERGGKLVWLGVRAGDRVGPGSEIARLDTQNLVAQRQLLIAQKAQANAVLLELQNGPRREVIASARSNVADLQDQLALERIKETRREYLYEQGAIAQEQLDEIAFRQKALQDRIDSAQSQVSELETGTRPEQVAAQQAVIQQIEAQIADLDITIAKSTILAPFGGTISERRLDEGTVVNSGQAIVRLVEGASPEVEIGIPAAAIAQLQPGSRHSLEIGGQAYAAQLTAIKPEVDPATRTQTAVLQLDAAAVQSVAPQQIARLSLVQTVDAAGFWLPLEALVEGDRGLWAAYAVVGDGAGQRAERRDVEVLYTEGNRALVRGMLQASDVVVATGVQRIVNGQEVSL